MHIRRVPPSDAHLSDLGPLVFAEDYQPPIGRLADDEANVPLARPSSPSPHDRHAHVHRLVPMGLGAAFVGDRRIKATDGGIVGHGLRILGVVLFLLG